MTVQRLQGWNKQTSTFTYAKDREFGPGLREANLYADLGVAKGTGGNFHAHLIKVNQRNIRLNIRPECTVMTMIFNLITCLGRNRFCNRRV
ncbi:MAG: hypothetical protein CM1200mP41_29650 [Gammaproteobacteria bacterium]|nr:MAG: hypothetical protein CM1200mP41_29650 [Gammaproteobacteria bacterium]